MCCARRSSVSCGPLRASAWRVAVSAARGVAPRCRARVGSSRTDSERRAARRDGAKGRFGPLVHVSRAGGCGTKSRVAISSGRGEQAARYPSAVCGGTDSRTGRVGPRRGLARRRRYTVKFLPQLSAVASTIGCCLNCRLLPQLSAAASTVSCCLTITVGLCLDMARAALSHWFT